ncbi:MAG: hypothetical protein QXU18_00475 [Thermoplasmatales archaeon]
MEIEIIQVHDLEKLQVKTPFLIFIPDGLELENLTYRNEGRKWSTLRFECVIDGERLRVKEFFLDWFYPGFPKSLMKSFVSSYSSLDSSLVKDWIVFFGTNYKGKYASSSFSLGTQVEVEGGSTFHVKRLSEMMVPPFLDEKFKNFPFYKRSFFANKGDPEWFEEKRIRNLTWGPPSDDFCINSLCIDSIGIFKKANYSLETVFTFSEDYYKRAAWVDIAKSGGKAEHLVYELRKNGNFFDEFEEGEKTIAFRRENGPTIARFERGDFVITVSLSPLFSLYEAKKVIEKLDEVVENQKRFI